jgi:hypothetical protein
MRKQRSNSPASIDDIMEWPAVQIYPQIIAEEINVGGQRARPSMRECSLPARPRSLRGPMERACAMTLTGKEGRAA